MARPARAVTGADRTGHGPLGGGPARYRSRSGPVPEPAAPGTAAQDTGAPYTPISWIE
ncbi:hypothetical protein SPRI_1499 [Streptomyces pristinaespiralis]|jgi:hypothetical protein|uniref:Uncharacterized protein n=1 Tax=Streptomyces pristinaespiralis TaxID=38300 RepID=A0A0M4DFH3_STRPR|nr:hypothetical protein SPRI_1499 [Streptomyces pristinaespiralis]